MAKVLFLQTVQFEFTGVMSISAYLKREGHQVELLLESEEGSHFFDRIKTYQPDLVAFSAMTGDHVRCLEIASDVKKRFDVPILMGGPHPTFFPETVEHPAIDLICREREKKQPPNYAGGWTRGAIIPMCAISG